MRDRFSGKEGRRRLCEALRKQSTLRCDEEVISAIAAAAKIDDYPPDSLLIVQDTDADSIAFILSGQVDIRVNDRHVAYRRDGQHVGEMSVIDPSARRSATVVAVSDTCVAWIDEPAFSAIADAHPSLWRALAMEIADRLRQRASLLRPPNEIVQLFIGSSGEALPIAKKIRDRLAKDAVEVLLWSEDVFGASEATMESLEDACASADFSIILFTADDVVEKRGKSKAAPRDNTIFELGLFMGAIGRLRTFFAQEEGKQIELPSDLLGITHLRISTADEAALEQSIGTVIDAVRKRIRERGAK